MVEQGTAWEVKMNTQEQILELEIMLEGSSKLEDPCKVALDMVRSIQASHSWESNGGKQVKQFQYKSFIRGRLYIHDVRSEIRRMSQLDPARGVFPRTVDRKSYLGLLNQVLRLCGKVEERNNEIDAMTEEKKRIDRVLCILEKHTGEKP